MTTPSPTEPKPPQSERLVFTVAIAVGLSIMGDSLMYGILPLEAESLGISLVGVGWLLSANRWIRLLSNTFVGGIFERWAPRWPFIGATILGFVTAALYGAGWGFGVFLLARMGWGVAWSGLRQGGYEAVWRNNPARKGKLMGVLWGIVRLGSAIGVVLGGYLRDEYGYVVSVSVIAGLTALAIPVAFLMRWPAPTADQPAPQTTANLISLEAWRRAFQVPVRRWLLKAAFTHSVLEGVIVATAAVFLAERLGDGDVLGLSFFGVGTVAGLLLAVRWTSNLLFGPLIGMLSDRIGQTQTIILLSGGLLLGLVGAITWPGWGLVFCLLAVFVTSAGLFITLSAASSGLALQAQRPQRFIGVYTTLTDAGSALGPLIAFNLNQWFGFGGLYLGLGSLLVGVVVWYGRVARETEGDMVG